MNSMKLSIRRQNEILDEAIGLIRTASTIFRIKKSYGMWNKVSSDVKKTLSNKKEYNKAFKEWKKKKTLKGQAKGVTSKSLSDFAGLFS